MVLKENLITGSKEISDYKLTDNKWITLDNKQYKAIIGGLSWIHTVTTFDNEKFIHGDLTSIGEIILNKIIKGE